MGARDPYLELRGPMELTRMALPVPAVRRARRAPVRAARADCAARPQSESKPRAWATAPLGAHARRPWCAWMSLFELFELAFDIANCFVCQWNVFATPLVCMDELV